MTHGIDAFYLERRRFERRLSGIVVGFSVALIALEAALGVVLRVPGVQRPRQDLHESRVHGRGGERLRGVRGPSLH